MLKTGYVKSDQEYKYIDDYFKNTSLSLTRINLVSEKTGFNANLWRSFSTRFLSSYKYAQNGLLYSMTINT
jgi:hypothetical protein